MTAKIVHAFRILNGQEAKVNSISKMIDGKMVLVWPLASPFYLDFNTIFGIPIHASVTCADSILAELPPFVSISPQAMLELVASDRLRAEILNGVALSSEPSLDPASKKMFFGGTSLVQDASVELRELEKSEHALPIPSVADFMAALKPIEKGVLNGVQPVNIEFLPLLSPAEKTGSEDAQATISHAIPRILEIKDLAVNENHPGIVDGEPIIATIIDAKNDKADPFLFHGDVLVADAVKRGVENTDPFLFRGTPLVANGLLTENEAISPIQQESISKIAKSCLMDSTRTLSLLLSVEPYTPVGFYAEQKVAQPMVTRLDLSTVHGQSEGHKKPAFYLLPTYSDIGLYGEEELLNGSVGTASILTEHKMQRANNIDVKAVQSSNTQVEPTHTVASEGVGKIVFSPILDSVPKLTDAFDGSNNTETVFPFYGAPNLMTGLAAESKVTDSPIFCGDALIADALEGDIKATSPFSQSGVVRIIGLSSMKEQQAFLLSLRAIPNYLLGACGENNSTVPMIGRMTPSIFSTQQEGCDEIISPSAPVWCLPVLDRGKDGAILSPGMAVGKFEPVLHGGEKTKFHAMLSSTLEAEHDYASAGKSEAHETVAGYADSVPITVDIGYTGNRLSNSFVVFGEPDIIDGLKDGTRVIGAFLQDGIATLVGVHRASEQQFALLSSVAIPAYLFGESGWYSASQSLVVKADHELFPVLQEGCDRANVQTSAASCLYGLGAGEEASADNFGVAISGLAYSLAELDTVDLCNGFSFAAQPIPAQLSVMRFDCDSRASAYAGVELETVEGIFTEGNLTDPMLVYGDISHIPISKMEKSGIFFAPIQGTPRTIEVGNSASGSPNVFTTFQGASTNMGTMEIESDNTYSVFQKVNHRQVETNHFDTKQTVLSSVFVIPYTPVINIGDGQSTPAVTGCFYPELFPIQSEGHDSPTIYSSMVQCSFDLYEPVCFDSTNFGAVAYRAEYRLVDPLVQYNMTTVGAEHNIRYSLREKMSLQTDYLPSTAFQTLFLEQHPMQTQHTVDAFGAYGVSDIQYREILRFVGRSEAGGMSVLFPDLIGTYEAKEAAPYGGCTVTEPELRDSLSIQNESVIRSSADTRPVIRLPIEAACGAALMGTNRMDHTPNVLEVVDLDSAHITTIDLLSIEEIDLWPVSANDEKSYFRYQF